MAKSDFDFKGILNTVRSTINPEYAIPSEKAEHPVNFRISRIKNLINTVSKQQQVLLAELNKLEVHVNGLIEEVQPYLNDEKKVSEEVKKEAAKEDAIDKSADTTESKDKVDTEQKTTDTEKKDEEASKEEKKD